MISPISASDEDDYESARSVYCWWRSAMGVEECAKLKLDFPATASHAPRLRVLRELERLALVAPEGLNELRHKLFTYSSGDFWVPTGGITKEEMDIPPTATILLVGFSRSGKSSLVNLAYSVLGQSGLIPFAQTSSGSSSKYAKMLMEEHNVLRSARSGFCMFDSRGFEYDGVKEGLDELSDWMREGVRHNQLCLRTRDLQALTEDDAVESPLLRSSSKFRKRRVNCAMVVANAAEIYKAWKAGDSKPLEATRELFCSPALSICNEQPILILTHGDILSSEERVDARLKICDYVKASEAAGVYDIVCLTEYGFLVDESDPVNAYALTEAVYRALLIADRNHLPKSSLQDWALLCLSCLMCAIAALFGFLAQVFSKLGHSDKKQLKW